MVVNDLLDYNIYEILYWMGFVNRNKFAIFDKMFYNDKDIVITNIIDKIFRFKEFNNEVYNNRILSSFKYK